MKIIALLRSTVVPGLWALALLLLPLSVSAQESAPKERKPSKETLEKYDADKDGKLSEEEAAKAKADAAAKGRETRKKNLEKYDADGDGKLSEAEKEKRKADEAADKAARKAEKKAEREAKQKQD
jgi:hypothetical protein